MVNEWTADDLPASIMVDGGPVEGAEWQLPDLMRKDIAAWLNEHQPKSGREEFFWHQRWYEAAAQRDDYHSRMDRAERDRDDAMDAETAALKRAKTAESECDRWRRAHEIVEGERDEARDRCRELERERDEWKARAEREERELAKERSQHSETIRVSGDQYLALQANLSDAQKSLRDAIARAEAAEASTAPAVTRDEIATVLRATDKAALEMKDAPKYTDLADAILALVSGADPAVHVIRESDLWDLRRETDGYWYSGSFHVADGNTEPKVDQRSRLLVRDVSIARAIEAEAGQDEDPVEAKAREMYAVAHPGVFVPKGDDAELAPFCRLAVHVLGQEADQ